MNTPALGSNIMATIRRAQPPVISVVKSEVLLKLNPMKAAASATKGGFNSLATLSKSQNMNAHTNDSAMIPGRPNPLRPSLAQKPALQLRIFESIEILSNSASEVRVIGIFEKDTHPRNMS